MSHAQVLSRRSPARIERHALGPRLFVLGRRVHEWHMGLAVLTVAGLLAGIAGWAGVPLAALIGGGVWLVVKDWRDMHPATRDTAAWSLGMHRVPGGPPAPPLRERVPALAAVGVASAAGAAGALLAPARARRRPDRVDRDRAAVLLRRHGSDTLSAFKLRADLPRRFSPDGRAFAAYRIEAGTMLLAGDPVGAPDALQGLLEDMQGFAHAHGLRMGAVGASDEFAAIARQHGMRRLYLGDEAVVSTGAMDLSGGARKSLRKAVNRVERCGYEAELCCVGDVDAATLAKLEAISIEWRGGRPERGFSMAHDVLDDALLPDALVLVARDADGRPRGFLHFAPVFGRPIVSLGFMRRERATPNGLTDFMVVNAARLLEERGIAEFSLNFAAFGRWLRAPTSSLECMLGRMLRMGDRWFQIERLHRFNAKFDPRWQPRYLLFERPAALPRVALAGDVGRGTAPAPAPPLAPPSPPRKPCGHPGLTVRQPAGRPVSPRGAWHEDTAARALPWGWEAPGAGPVALCRGS